MLLPSLLPDSSYASPDTLPCAGAAFAGLGFGVEEPKYAEDDAFSTYRQHRSSAYKDFMGRNAAAAVAPTGTAR